MKIFSRYISKSYAKTKDTYRAEEAVVSAIISNEQGIRDGTSVFRSLSKKTRKSDRFPDDITKASLSPRLFKDLSFAPARV